MSSPVELTVRVLGTCSAIAILLLACTSGAGSGTSSSGGSSGTTTPTDGGGTSPIQDCPAGKGDCNGDPADGCETELTFDADNCGRCARRCEDGECRGATCAGVKIPESSSVPTYAGGPIALTDDRIYFAARDLQVQGTPVWSTDKKGKDARRETEVSVRAFTVAGDTLFAINTAVTQVHLIDRVSRATKKTISVDPERNECLDSALYASGTEAIIFCQLPARSFNAATENAILALDESGKFRTLYRGACGDIYTPCWERTGGYGSEIPTRHWVVDGRAAWTVRTGVGEHTLNLVSVAGNDATMPATTYGDVIWGLESKFIVNATGTLAFNGEYMVYEAKDSGRGQIAPGMEPEGATYLRAAKRSTLESGKTLRTTGFRLPTLEEVAHSGTNSLYGVAGLDSQASYFALCRDRSTDCRDNVLAVMPWRQVTRNENGQSVMHSSMYFLRGGGAVQRTYDADAETQVYSDDTQVYWTEADNAGGGADAPNPTLWRGPR